MEEAVQQFVSITNAEPSEALHILEAAGGDLDAAVQLFFEGGGATGSGASLEAESEALARQLMQEGDIATGSAQRAATDAPSGSGVPAADFRAGLPDGDVDPDTGVRRADAARVERLYDGPGMHIRSMMGSLAGTRAPVRDVRLASFGDGDGSLSLQGIYQPPRALTNDLTLDELKQMALKKDQWMLINVQDPSEFASLQLNADLWSKDLLTDVIRSNFQFAQRTLPGNDAEQLKTAYQLYSLPAIIVLDPNTGQKMHEWRGTPDPDKFMEDLLAFTATPPSDPSAGNLVSGAVRQANFAGPAHVPISASGVAGVSDEDEQLNKVIAESMAAHGTASVAGTSRPASSRAALMEESSSDYEALMEQAIAASLAQEPAISVPPASAPAEDLSAEPDMDEPEVAEVRGEDVVAAAASRLRPEPTAPGEGCRVAIRMPNGRAVRAFHKDDPVSAVYDFVTTQLSPEEAVSGFELCHATPGGAALSDREQSVQAAGLCGSMLQLKWM